MSARWAKLLGFVAALALLAAVLLWLDLDWAALWGGDLAEGARALQRIASRGGAWTVGMLLLLAALLPFALVPMTVVNVAAAALLPSWLAVVVIVLGDSLNTALAWAAGRFWGEGLLCWFGGDRLGLVRMLRPSAQRHGFWMAILSRFIPSPFVLQAAAGAVVGISAWAMVLGTATAMLPWALLCVFALEAVKQGQLALLGPVLVLLLVLGGLAWVARGRLGMRKEETSSNLGPLVPRCPSRGPQLKFYTLPGDPACQEAREELARLRDELGFEVQETDLSVYSGPESRFRDYVPVVCSDSDEERIFSFQIDAHALATHLQRLKQGQL